MSVSGGASRHQYSGSIPRRYPPPCAGFSSWKENDKKTPRKRCGERARPDFGVDAAVHSPAYGLSLLSYPLVRPGKGIGDTPPRSIFSHLTQMRLSDAITIGTRSQPHSRVVVLISPRLHRWPSSILTTEEGDILLLSPARDQALIAPEHVPHRLIK